MKNEVKLTKAERKRYAFEKIVKEFWTFQPGQSHGIPYFSVRWLLETPESLAEALGSQFEVTRPNPRLVTVTRKAKASPSPTSGSDSCQLQSGETGEETRLPG